MSDCIWTLSLLSSPSMHVQYILVTLYTCMCTILYIWVTMETTSRLTTSYARAPAGLMSRSHDIVDQFVFKVSRLELAVTSDSCNKPRPQNTKLRRKVISLEYSNFHTSDLSLENTLLWYHNITYRKTWPFSELRTIVS